MATMLWFVLLVAVAVASAEKNSKTLSKRRSYTRQAPCKTKEFHCKTGRCIQIDWVCDTEPDCIDGSDEVDCPTNCTGIHQFKCDNGKCISREYRCDYEDDCGDLSDEAECDNVECRPGEVECDNDICIDDDWVCDGEDDCTDGWDESNCGGRTPATVT